MPALLYDGACSLCRRSVAWVQARDPDRVLELLPFQDPSVATRFPTVPRAQCLRAAQFVSDEGRVFAGAAAVREVLALLPSTRRLAALLRVPPFFWLARGVYWMVARLRPRDRCTLSSA